MLAFLGGEFGDVKEARHFENSLGRKPDHLPRPGGRDLGYIYLDKTIDELDSELEAFRQLRHGDSGSR